ncbi:hypothetical protein [Asanoa iriomotensis]|uniref:Secreted protein n=1 Tax=Asanoa iriomotensis TaxID=234613 RepID=A0ABQ4C0B6_9ACTN|nr:hypothetical protein [Asanoa iriomotensis]GIF56219.1 hypothetical protein Air01nite_23140 [Asanoa iriomotensis]
MRRSLVVPLLVLGLGLAACDSAGATPGVATAGGGTPAASASAADEDDGREFAACMREHGVDMPDPQPGGGLGVELDKLDKTKVLDAVDACRDVMPGGGKDVKLNPDQLERQRALAECMRANGVPDFPDPDPDGGGAVREYILDKHDDDVLAALDKCRDIVPTPSSRPGVGK